MSDKGRSDHPPTLEYAAPPVFFRGEHSTRGPYTILNAAFAGPIGLATLGAGPLLLPRADPNGRQILVVLGVALLLFAAWNAWQWQRNATRVVRLTGDGIEVGRRFWPWTGIARVGGIRSDFGVLLYFEPPGRFALRRPVDTTPPLKDEVFYALCFELERHFATRNLQVTVAREVESSD